MGLSFTAGAAKAFIEKRWEETERDKGPLKEHS